MQVDEILKRIETYKGRKLDLNKKRDRFYLFSEIDREINKREAVIHNVGNVLKGFSTYDKTNYKTILNSNK